MTRCELIRQVNALHPTVVVDDTLGLDDGVAFAVPLAGVNHLGCVGRGQHTDIFLVSPDQGKKTLVAGAGDDFALFELQGPQVLGHVMTVLSGSAHDIGPTAMKLKVEIGTTEPIVQINGVPLPKKIGVHRKYDIGTCQSIRFVFTRVNLEVPGVPGGDSSALADSVHFDAEPRTLLGVVLTELQPAFELPKGLVGRNLAGGMIDALEIVDKFIEHGAELIQTVSVVCLTVVHEVKVRQ